MGAAADGAGPEASSRPAGTEAQHDGMGAAADGAGPEASSKPAGTEAQRDNIDGSWVLLPDEADDPRYDAHGFRRMAESFADEEAFNSSYAAKLALQERRWGRRTWTAEEIAAARRHELKRLVRQGIPADRRGTVWPALCRAQDFQAREPAGYYRALLARAPHEHERSVERQIELDITRTFPGHRLLTSAEGIAKLRKVLVAYARRNPRVGYVQGMGFIAALLLVFIADDELAFWTLSAIVEHHLPADYFSATLVGLRAEQAVFAELLALKLPRLARHMALHCVHADFFSTRWFVAIFANTLPIETTLRVWDCFLLEGIKLVHRVGLALLRVAERRLLRTGDQQQLLCALQDEQGHCFDCERLLYLATDRRAFLRSFPRKRVDALRAKHHRRLVQQEPPTRDDPPAQPARPQVETPRGELDSSDEEEGEEAHADPGCASGSPRGGEPTARAMYDDFEAGCEMVSRDDLKDDARGLG